MAANILKRLERYFITIVEDKTATKKERANAASYLAQLRIVNTPSKVTRTALSNVLGSKAGE